MVDLDSRAERRRFIRVNHPDHGGDPKQFMAGLRAFESPPQVSAAATGPTQITSDVETPWPVSLVTRLIWNFHRLPH